MLTNGPFIERSPATTALNIAKRKTSLERVIERRAAKLLESHPHFKGRSRCIYCRISNRRLYLSGSVPSFYLKQLAQEAVRHLEDVDRIENRIVVASPVGEVCCERPLEPPVKPR